MTYTTAVVRHSKDGATAAVPLGRAAYGAQLNGALRQLAGLGFDQYLSDNTPPTDHFILQGINLLLTLHAQRRRCWALPSRLGPAALGK